MIDVTELQTQVMAMWREADGKRRKRDNLYLYHHGEAEALRGVNALIANMIRNQPA